MKLYMNTLQSHLAIRIGFKPFTALFWPAQISFTHCQFLKIPDRFSPLDETCFINQNMPLHKSALRIPSRRDNENPHSIESMKLSSVKVSKGSLQSKIHRTASCGCPKPHPTFTPMIVNGLCSLTRLGFNWHRFHILKYLRLTGLIISP